MAGIIATAAPEAAEMLRAEVLESEDRDGLPVMIWRCGSGWRMASSTVIGGGIGPRQWVLNAQVPADYSRTDPDRHLRELAIAYGLHGQGAGMLTAATVARFTQGQDGGVGVLATIGLAVPTLAASDSVSLASAARKPGTINLIAAIPAAMNDGALVNAIVTATEAKSQALIQTGFKCTGTASDAVCVAALESGSRAAFGGPRSPWGSRLARAVHDAVLKGALSWLERNPSALDGLQPVEAFSPARSFE